MSQRLYLMVGYPGSGKTTAAKLISKLAGAVHLWADKERQKLFVKPTYKHDENIKLYAYLNEVAEKLLQDGQSVVYDTNFNFYKDRQRLRQAASKSGAETTVIWIKAPKEVAKARATKNAHLQDTRVLGNMPESHFERISQNLEEPQADEQPIVLDGQHINEQTVRTALHL